MYRVHQTLALAQRAKATQKIKKIKIPRVTDEGWNSQKELSGPVEKKRKEKTLVSSSKALTRFRPFTLK